jgi:hypothetical protein
MDTRLRDRLLLDGRRRLEGPADPVAFTREPGADRLLNDLEDHPHAFLLASLGLRQIKPERAWLLPYLVRERLGSFEMEALTPLSEADWLALLRNVDRQNRTPVTTARSMHRGVTRIEASYGGDASRVWSDRPTSATLLRRLLEFYGSGPKIAGNVAHTLVGDFHIELADYRNIDITTDAYMRRVMGRLGFVDPDAEPDVVVYTARELSPEFPGIFDVALRDGVRMVCLPHSPGCPSCRLVDLCPSAGGVSSAA